MSAWQARQSPDSVVNVCATWHITQSSATAGHYGNDYAFAATQAVSDPATFWFYLDAPATRTIDAWWTYWQDVS